MNWRFIGSAAFLIPVWAGAQTGMASHPVQGTFLNFYRNLTPELWRLEFEYMKDAGIDTVIISSAGHLAVNGSQAESCQVGSATYTDDSGYGLAAEGLIYRSKFVSTGQQPQTDLLEMVLGYADEMGMSVYVGSLATADDWTNGGEFCALRTWNRSVAQELLGNYGQHLSLKGWYFTQEIWMNWVKYYAQLNGGDAAGYYGTNLVGQWVSDMKALDPAKTAMAVLVVKETGSGAMPGLSAAELAGWTQEFAAETNLDILMPEDGAGAQAGAPPLSDLASYYEAMSKGVAAGGTNALLWSTVEMFTASGNTNVAGEQYLPASDIGRIQSQIANVKPYVSGYVGWIFGDDLSPQATYYPVEASELNRKYQSVFGPQTSEDDVLPIASYWYPAPQPSASYPDSSGTPKLSDGTGGGYSSSLADWVGFSDASADEATTQVIADLGSVRTIHSVEGLTQSWTGSGIYHPLDMTVEVSADGAQWSAYGSSQDFPADTQSFAVMWGEVDGSAMGRYVRWTFRYQSWLMLAELEVIGPQ